MTEEELDRWRILDQRMWLQKLRWKIRLARNPAKWRSYRRRHRNAQVTLMELTLRSNP